MTQTSPKKIGELNEFPSMNFVENSSFPMDINSSKFTPISLPPLIWLHLDKMPSKVNIRNSGYLMNVEPEYSGEAPSLNGSVLRCPYKFWCFHFHWGSDNENGGEHRIDGKRLPMEIHLVFFNVKYSNTHEALKAKDGLLVLVYMCKLTVLRNVTLETLLSNLEKISEPNKSTRVDVFPMSSLFDGDLTDYMLYWRAYGKDNEKQTPWIISLKPILINESQLSCMRSLHGINSPSIVSNHQCQREYRRSEDVFVVTADGSRACAGNAGDDRVGNVVATPAPDAADSYDLEGGGGGGRARETERGDDPGAKRTGPAKTTTATQSIEIMVLEQNDFGESKIEASEPRKAQKTHREGVRMNETAIRREIHIKNKLQKNAELKK